MQQHIILKFNYFKVFFNKILRIKKLKIIPAAYKKFSCSSRTASGFHAVFSSLTVPHTNGPANHRLPRCNAASPPTGCLVLLVHFLTPASLLPRLLSLSLP